MINIQYPAVDGIVLLLKIDYSILEILTEDSKLLPDVSLQAIPA